MSLVNYGSSDESESSDSEETNAPFPTSTVSSSDDATKRTRTQLPVSSARSLLSSLPPPKSSKPEKVVDNIGYGERPNRPENTVKSNRQDTKPSSTTARPISSLNLPPPKKGQPVKITVPSLPDPDSDEDEPAPKKIRPESKGTGLFAVLPQPKHAVAKENNRILIPHTLTKKPTQMKPAVPLKPKRPAGKATGTTAFRDYGSDDEDEPSSFFSFGEKDTKKPDSATSVIDVKPASAKSVLDQTTVAVSSSKAALLTFVEPSSSRENSESSVHRPTDVTSMNEPLRFSSHPAARADEPLSFGQNSNVVSSSSHGYAAGDNSYNYSQQYEQGYQDYNQPYQETYPQYTGAEDQIYGYHGNDQEQYQAESTSQEYLNDEGFKRLHGKKRHGEAIRIIDIQEDRQDYSSREWLNKNISEEKEYRSKLGKEQGPTSQQRKKHQITYLAHQAKERELELKNSWAENRLTRKQTQAKYGF